MKKLLRLSAVISVIFFPKIASAVPMESTYPVAQKNANPVCYMEQQEGSTLDLTRLCASSARPIRSGSSGNTLTNNSYSGFNSSPSSSSSGSSISSKIPGRSGNCYSPDDIAADGYRCGGRAASVRPQENTNTSSSRIGERTLPQGTIIQFRQRSR
jgi:hypothetical protein